MVWYGKHIMCLHGLVDTLALCYLSAPTTLPWHVRSPSIQQTASNVVSSGRAQCFLCRATLHFSRTSSPKVLAWDIADSTLAWACALPWLVLPGGLPEADGVLYRFAWK